MADDRVSALIELGIDKALAEQSIKQLDAMQKGIQDAKKQAEAATKALRQLAGQGRQLREVGTVMAGIGASILAPLTLAANQYANTFKNLEPAANAYNAALAKQKEATTALGREAATALIPVMNQIADFEKQVADFAAAHPDLMRVAVTAGTALVAGGGALIAAGTAISTIARAAELLKSIAGSGVGGQLGGAITKATVSVGALAAGAELAVVGLNAYGKATGDARLAQYNLNDALKTARELVVSVFLTLAKAFIDAKLAIGRTIDTLVALGAKLQSSLADTFDLIATGFRKIINDIRGGFTNVINGILDLVARAVSLIPGLGGAGDLIRGAKTSFDADAANKAEAQGYLDRQKQRDTVLGAAGQQLVENDKKRLETYQQDQDNLAKLAGAAANFAETGTIPGVGGSTSSAATKSPSPLVSPEGVQAYIEYSQKLRDLDRQDKQALLDLKRNFDDQEKKAEQEKQNQIDKINTDYMRNQLKATQDFQRQEARDLQTAAKERLRTLQDMYDNMFDAAESNDVVGFLNAQRAGNKQLNQQKQDADEADRQRIQDFQRQQAEAAQNRQYQLDDLDISFKQQKELRKQSYDEQRQALLTKQAEEKRLLDQDFAQKLASLEGNLAGLQAIQQQYYANQTAAFQQYLNANQTALQNAIRTSYGISGSLTNGTSGGSVAPSQSGVPQSVSNNLGRTVPSFDSGIDFVPRDMLALVHRGERITPAAQNGTPSVTVDLRGAQLTGGATKADLELYKEATIDAVATAWHKVREASQ